MCRCINGGRLSSKCRHASWMSASTTTLWSTKHTCRSCYLAARLHVKQLGKKTAFAAMLNWENVKFPSWKQPDTLPRLLSHLKAFPLAKACLPISFPFSLTNLFYLFSHYLAPPLWYHSLPLSMSGLPIYKPGIKLKKCIECAFKMHFDFVIVK